MWFKFGQVWIKKSLENYVYVNLICLLSFKKTVYLVIFMKNTSCIGLELKKKL